MMRLGYLDDSNYTISFTILLADQIQTVPTMIAAPLLFHLYDVHMKTEAVW